MALELLINSGETYTIDNNRLEEWRNTVINGQLDLSNGSIALIDNPDESTQPSETKPETGFPISRNLNELSTPMAILLATLFSLNAFVAVKFKSPLFIMSWAITIIVFVMVILIDLSIIWLWLTLLVTAIITILSALVIYRE